MVAYSLFKTSLVLEIFYTEYYGVAFIPLCDVTTGVNVKGRHVLSEIRVLLRTGVCCEVSSAYE